MSAALLIGFACLGAQGPLTRAHEDEFPARCAQIERVGEAVRPQWSIILRIDGKDWALETDLTLRECWRLKPRGATCEK